MKALPPATRNRTRLYDRQFRLLYDSAVDSTAPYQHISDFCNMVIDRPDGSRWSGYCERCPEGIKSFPYADWEVQLVWATPNLSRIPVQ